MINNSSDIMLKLQDTINFLTDQESIYDIILKKSNIKVGVIEFRVWINERDYYMSDVGYYIEPAYRGNALAYYACIKLFDFIKKDMNIKEVFISCSPENIPSYKTLLKLNGTLIATKKVPKDHILYYRDEKIKHIFYFDLTKEAYEVSI